MQRFSNAARATLAAGITDTATTLTLDTAANADRFPVATTGTGPVPGAAPWFKAVLQDAQSNVEIIYVRTRAAGSAVFAHVLRGQEGTTARAFAAGSVVGLRVTALDMEGAIAGANNSVQLTGDQSVGGVKTFTSQIVASGGVQGDVTGNAATATTAGNVTGTVAVANGGTGSTTAAAARTALGTDNAANVTTGVFDAARLGTGSADASTVLHGNGVWQRPAPTFEQTFLLMGA